MVEAGSRRSPPVPAAIAVLPVLAVAGVVADGHRGDAGRTSPAAGVGPPATTPGCGSAPALASGTHTIPSNGRNRTFILRLPDTYDANRPYRLVTGYPVVPGKPTSFILNGATCATA
jgi:hypothetical protein